MGGPGAQGETKAVQETASLRGRSAEACEVTFSNSPFPPKSKQPPVSPEAPPALPHGITFTPRPPRPAALFCPTLTEGLGPTTETGLNTTPSSPETPAAKGSFPTGSTRVLPQGTLSGHRFPVTDLQHLLLGSRPNSLLPPAPPGSRRSPTH